MCLKKIVFESRHCLTRTYSLTRELLGKTSCGLCEHLVLEYICSQKSVNRVCMWHLHFKPCDLLSDLIVFY